MKSFRFAGLIAVSLLAVSSTGLADGREPGSALLYPIHRSGVSVRPEYNGTLFLTVVSVTNTNLSPLDGATNVQFEYVNTVYNPDDPCKPLACTVVDRVEPLTPADTLSVLTTCHNVGGSQEGYLVVSAQDPSQFKTAWSFNHLVGSETVVTTSGVVFTLNAMPFSSPLAEGDATDLDLDGQLDFDGVEYEGVPDTVTMPVFFGHFKSSMVLVNLTGGTAFDATVKYDAFNDNEFPLSTTKAFRCWMDSRLPDISLIFDGSFLANNTPNDIAELDINCNGVGGIETGWARITGVVANSSVESIQDPAVVGAICTLSGFEPLWESKEKQFNGDFLKFGSDDPEN